MTTTTIEARRVIAERMEEAARTFLDALSTEQRAQATLDFEDETERTLWSYTPGVRKGLPLRGMDGEQERIAHRLVGTGLSRGGYVTASTIIGLENTLDGMDGWRDRSGPSSFLRDPGLYYLAVFGEPGAARWGWRIGGHHLCLHYTIVDGSLVSPTPTFFGAHPAEAPFVGTQVLRPLAGEEDLARELLRAFDDGQRAIAVVAPVAPQDITQSNRAHVEEGAFPRSMWDIFPYELPAEELGPRREREEQRIRDSGLLPEHLEAVRYTAGTPKGLAGAAMTGAQREILGALVHQYVGRMPDELAELELERFTPAMIEALHFVWAGGAEFGQPHYYRVQGPRFLIEFDKVQNDARHIHSVWRDPEGDWGFDVLGQHYAQHH